MKTASRLQCSSFWGHDGGPVGEESPAKKPAGSRFFLAAILAIAGCLARPVFAQVQEPCGVSALCLGEGRFQFLVFWDDPQSGGQNVGHPVLLTPDSGYFWFFGPTNIEVTVKAVDGCSQNGHEWVFISGMTNLYVRIEVTDVQEGTHKTYTSLQGAAFETVQDTGTFTNCPHESGGPVDGAWTGTFDSADLVDCDSNTPAHASLTQEGSSVVGTLSSPGNFCGPDNALFSGTLQGDTLTGTVVGHDVGTGPYTNAHAFGTVTGTRLELVIFNGSGLIPGGTLHLHR